MRTGGVYDLLHGMIIEPAKKRSTTVKNRLPGGGRDWKYRASWSRCINQIMFSEKGHP